MGARIEAVATASGRRGLLAPGMLRLSDRAARACLRNASRRSEEVTLLVNAGVYKEKAMAEPALAAVIQDDIGANKSYGGRSPRRARHGTFSFDVMNGGCGALTAAHLVDAFVGSGTAQLGLIVAADADPSPARSRGFPFAPVGGAMLLEHTTGSEGFAGFEFHTFPQDPDGEPSEFEATLRWEEGKGRRRGRNVLEVREDPRFASFCLAHAREVSRGFLARSGLHESDVDLLIASQYPPSFARDLAQELGMASDRVPRVDGELGPAHTAGPLVALEASVESGQFSRSHTVLLVTAGAGITIGVALYRR
jgi:3-oxoacyl-[acyl-carrier-protein] synthase III